MGANFSCVNCVDVSESVDNLHKKEKDKRKEKYIKTSSSQDQTSQHFPSTSEAEVLSIAEEPGHADVDDEWSDYAFQDLLRDLSEWGADVLNSLGKCQLGQKAVFMSTLVIFLLTDVGFCSYEVGRMLGEGAFGSVYAGTRLKDGLKVALKIADNVDIDWINIEDNPEPVPQEIGLLILAHKGPRVPQIIQLLDWVEEPDRHIMVLEFPTPCESLIEYLDRHDYILEENVAKVIMHQATVAAQTCCQRGVLHRDIKLENLLINPDTLDVKLIDFGCGEILTDAGYTSFAEQYCPPEYILYGFYHGKPATVWSLGVLMFTLVCGEFPESEDLDLLNDNIWARDGLSQECCKLLCSFLQRNPENRLELDVVCLHKWFKYFFYSFNEERSEDLLQKDLPPAVKYF